LIASDELFLGTSIAETDTFHEVGGDLRFECVVGTLYHD
jgi:hypothetical protein